MHLLLLKGLSYDLQVSLVSRGLPSLAKEARKIGSAGLKISRWVIPSLRSSWVQLPPPALSVLSHIAIIKFLPSLVITSKAVKSTDNI